MEDAVDWVLMARFVAVDPGVYGDIAEYAVRKGHRGEARGNVNGDWWEE